MRVCIVSNESSTWGALICSIKRRSAIQIQLFSDLHSIRFSDFDLVVYAGFLPATVVREFQVPAECKRHDIPNSVEYQFVRALPYEESTDLNYWEYIRLPVDSQDKSYCIRAAAVTQQPFQEQIESLQQLGIKIDQFYLTPLFFSEQYFPNANKYAPPRKQEIINYFATENILEFHEFIQECNLNQLSDPVIQINLFIAKQYLCSVNGKSDLYMSRNMQQAYLHPLRCHTLKQINLFLCSILLLVICIMTFKHFSYSYQIYSQLKTQNKTLSQRIRELQRETLRVNEEVQLLQRYDELNPGHPDLRPVLLEITQKIPSYMWIDSFRFSNGTLELSVKSEKDDINFYKNLKEASRYKLVNLRKNRATQGKTEYSVTLKVETL